MKRVFSAGALLLAVLLPSPSWTASIDKPVQAASIPALLSSPTRMLIRIALQQNGSEATIMMTGDGRLSYRIRPLSTDRVIVDLLNASTKLPHAFEFDDPTVRQIRVGQHPNVLRLVIDLRQTAVYSVEERKNTLSIVLTPRADTPRASDAAIPAQDLSVSMRRLNTVDRGRLSRTQEQTVRERFQVEESDHAGPEPRPKQEVRNRAVDRRLVDPPPSQSAIERYVAAFGGFSIAQSFTQVHGTGANASVNVSNLSLARTGIGGLKFGFSPSTAKWLALETEVFYASPHFKQQPVTVSGNSGTATDDFSGSHTRVATWALNWIVRYPGEWIQPYAGAGLGIFWGRLADSGGASSSDTSPGLNAMAGLRIRVGHHLILFSEYKYNRASFDFSNSDFHVLYQAHYVVGGLGWSF
jgi:opacity protein-like surface antigen